MRITIVLGAFLPVPAIMGGAVEKVWLMLGQEFARRGHQVVIVSRAVAQFPNEETIEGVRHLRVPGFDTPRSLPWLKVLDFIYSVRVRAVLPSADIVVTNTFWLPMLLRDRSRGQMYVHVARYPKGQMRFYRRAARLQAPSSAVAHAIAKQAPALGNRTKTIPYPAPPTVAEPAPPPVVKRDRIILYVGRVHPEKGVHLLIDAFTAGARTVFAKWKLMIVGPTAEKFGGGGEPYLASLRSLAQAAANQVTLAGPIFEPAQLARTFRSARLFVYPSLAEHGESFGLAPLEAMASGCAVLVSNLECFQDFIADGESGFVFNHRSMDASLVLRQRMEQAIADETLLARTAEAGYRKSAEYSLPRVADQFLDDFKLVTQNSDAGSTSR
jgi:glycosyltransferase involved in cell wall biosynthesis